MTRIALGVVWAALAAVGATDSQQLQGTIALTAVSGVLVALGVRSREPRALTAGTGVLVGAYALSLVGRDGVDGRVPVVAALVVALALLGSWTIDPGLRSGREPRATQVTRVLAAGGVVAAVMAATSLLALGVVTLQFTGWLTLAVAVTAAGGALLLTARSIQT